MKRWETITQDCTDPNDSWRTLSTCCTAIAEKDERTQELDSKFKEQRVKSEKLSKGRRAQLEKLKRPSNLRKQRAPNTTNKASGSGWFSDSFRRFIQKLEDDGREFEKEQSRLRDRRRMHQKSAQHPSCRHLAESDDEEDRIDEVMFESARELLTPSVSVCRRITEGCQLIESTNRSDNSSDASGKEEENEELDLDLEERKLMEIYTQFLNERMTVRDHSPSAENDVEISSLQKQKFSIPKFSRSRVRVWRNQKTM